MTEFPGTRGLGVILTETRSMVSGSTSTRIGIARWVCSGSGRSQKVVVGEKGG